jgi:hypothetical protein
MRLPDDAAQNRQQISTSLHSQPLSFDGFEVKRVDSTSTGMTLSVAFVKAGKQSLGSRFQVSRGGAPWLNVKCDVVGTGTNVSIGFGNVENESRTLLCQAPGYTLELKEYSDDHLEGEVRLGNEVYEMRTSEQLEGRSAVSPMVGLHLYNRKQWRASVDAVNPRAFLATDLSPIEHDALVLSVFSFASIRDAMVNGPRAGTTGRITTTRY